MKKVVIQLAIVSLLLAYVTPATSGELSRKQIRETQELLKNAGFDPGPIDGILGPRTRAAIRRYQATHGLPKTGSLDEATRAVLGRKDSRQPSDGTTKFGVGKALQKGAIKVTGLPKKPEETLVLTRSNAVRLAILVGLGLGAWAFGHWLLLTAIGAALAFVMNALTGWGWVWSFQAGLAAVYVIPLLLKLLFGNFRLTLAFAILFGVPTFLISRFYFDSGFIRGVCDSVALMHLAPGAILRTLIKTDIIKLPSEPAKISPSHTETVYRTGAPSTGGASSPITTPSSRRFW